MPVGPRASRVALGRASPSAKRAEKVADSIIEDVMALGWPVGQILGSEADLLARYQVSRAVFREAVRLLENQQVAGTKRGRSGGLVITEPGIGPVIDAVVLYLHRVGARLDEVLEAQIILEEVATRRALERLDDNDAARLQAFAESPFEDLGPDPKALHRFIASLTRNPALELFVEVVGRVVMLYSPDWRQITAQAEKTKRAHAGIAAAALAGNTELAQRRMRWHLGAEADLLRATGSTRQLLPERVMLTSNTGKGAEAVARNITQMIIDAGMEAGELVGAETQLIESEGVSRAILREAVRLLEHHEIARMRRGPGGGLFVVQPSTRAVTDVVALYLARRGMQLSGLAEFRTDVEVAIVSLAVAHIDEEGIRRLQQVSIREEGCSSVERVEDAHDLHAAVAVSAQSRVLELVALVLLRLSSRHGIECLADRAHDRVREEVLRAHRGIVDALTRGDRDVACERMRRHLGAITVRTR